MDLIINLTERDRSGPVNGRVYTDNVELGYTQNTYDSSQSGQRVLIATTLNLHRDWARMAAYARAEADDQRAAATRNPSQSAEQALLPLLVEVTTQLKQARQEIARLQQLIPEPVPLGLRPVSL